MEETVELYYQWKETTDAIEDAKEMLHEEKKTKKCVHF